MSLDEQGRVIGSDITTPTRNIFESLKSAFAEPAAIMEDMIKHNVYFQCDGDDEAVNKLVEELDRVRLDYLSDPGPTATETRVGLEREGALLLVDAWAVIGAEKQRLVPSGHWSWNKQLPFSHGWRVGDMIFIGGQRSFDREGRIICVGDIEVQTDWTFHNLDTMLQEAGGNRSSLMRQYTYFRFFGEGPEVTEYWEKMTNVRLRFMSVPSPAGAGIRVSGFPRTDELIQVECIGFLGKDKQQLQPANHWDWSITGNRFTQDWRANDFAFVGGQISADNHARAVGEDMATQARNVFQFIRRILPEADFDESDVQREFSDPGPLTTAIRASGFAFEDLLVEIESIAVCRNRCSR